MQEIAAKLLARLESVEERLVQLDDKVFARLESVEERLVQLDDKMCKLVMGQTSKKEKNALRRQYYRERKAEAFKDRMRLPDFNILGNKDKRLQKAEEWADIGLRFGKADRPEAFISWLVYAWNNECYLKKPITFSGGTRWGQAT